MMMSPKKRGSSCFNINKSTCRQSTLSLFGFSGSRCTSKTGLSTSYAVDSRLIVFNVIISTVLLLLVSPVLSTESPQDNMINSQELKIFAMTWNVNGKAPTEDMRRALQLDNSTNQPDFYVFALQEAPSPLSSSVVEDPWSAFFRQLLGQHNYIKVNEVKMQAIHLIIFAKRPLLTKIKDVEINWTRTGFAGLWGNKGGVSIRMTMNGCHVCFLSCHLAAHDHKLDQRISDYKRIVYGQTFQHPKTQHILSHDQVIIMGDLNFRINDLTSDEIYDKIVEGSPESLEFLLKKDQLNIVRQEHKAFTEFEEVRPTFWPTYKFKHGTNIYDRSKRKPAFTDRILFKRLEGNLIIQEQYRSHPDFLISDHKPVSSLFQVKLYKRSPRTHIIQARDVRDFAGEPEEEVEEDHNISVKLKPMTAWSNDEENEIFFSFVDDKNSSNLELASKLNRDWDWIAVVPTNFDSLDQWITYQWVKGSEEIPEGSSTAGFSIKMSGYLIPGSSYRLIYFHGRVGTSVLGISNPFTVSSSSNQ